jgi:putative DNA primase/helicase
MPDVWGRVGLGLSDKALKGKDTACPMCGGKDRFRISDKGGNGTWYCHHERFGGDGIELVKRVLRVDFVRAAQLIEGVVGKATAYGAYAGNGGNGGNGLKDPLKFWRDANPDIFGASVDFYLRNRGVQLTETEARALRFHPALWHWPTQTKWPAMIAAVGPFDGPPVTCHQTFIEPDGSGKAPLEKARLFPSGAAPIGGVWFGLASPDHEFIVAEGIESMLSAMRLYDAQAGYAALSDNGVRFLSLPPAARSADLRRQRRTGAGGRRRHRGGAPVEKGGALGRGDHGDRGRRGRERCPDAPVKGASREAGAMSNDLIVIEGTFEGCLRDAHELKKGDDAGVRTILTRAAEIGIDDLQAEVLINVLRDKTGIGKKTIRGAWKVLKEKADKDRWEKAEKERLREAAAWAARGQQQRDEEKARLWASCSKIAESPKLLAGMEAMAHELGVVNEGANARALYLVSSSRLLADEAARLLRRGAPASGKNAVVEKVLKFIPSDAVIHISGSSPKMLPYYGGDDPDALKHKIVYIPEAVILAKKPGDSDNEFAVMLRTLLSEARLVYQTVVIRPDGTRETQTFEKNGPIVAILTTADEIDLQLKTRVLIQDTDETGGQTAAIVKSILSRRRAPFDLQPWINFQLLLEMDAPYQVDVPFTEAISEAFDQWRPKFLEDASMRMRRDIGSFLTIVKTSAVLHKAQRKVAEDGAVIADIADYRHAYEAFDPGLASVHGEVSEKVIAVVEAIEEMQNENQDDLHPDSVKVTLRELAKRLRVASISTAKARRDEAVDCGAIEYDDAMTGRGGARWFRVEEKSKDLRAKPGLGVFPPPDIVEKCFSAAFDPETAEHSEHLNKKADGEAGKARI